MRKNSGTSREVLDLMGSYGKGIILHGGTAGPLNRNNPLVAVSKRESECIPGGGGVYGICGRRLRPSTVRFERAGNLSVGPFTFALEGEVKGEKRKPSKS